MARGETAFEGKILLLRFGSSVEQRQNRRPARERWRLWMLFAAACLVVVFMRFLQEPRTVERIDSLFTRSGQKEPSDRSARVSNANSEVAILAPLPTEPDQPQLAAAGDSSQEAHVDLSAIKDNTYFRAEENVAWFATLKHLQTLSSQRLKQDSVGEVTYAQFLKQPETYRGKIVTISGTAMREELIEAPPNDLGIDQYHRLIIRPTGGGVWPLVVYSLALPEKFPRGDNLHADVHVIGIFFKNWSYAWQDGLGLAPVVLAKSVEWQPHAVVPAKRPEVSWHNLVSVIIAGSLLMMFVGWFAWRCTRRPSSSLGRQNIVITLPSEISEAER